MNALLVCCNLRVLLEQIHYRHRHYYGCNEHHACVDLHSHSICTQPMDIKHYGLYNQARYRLLRPHPLFKDYK